jgi:electron transfer flavoprotein beta subunit
MDIVVLMKQTFDTEEKIYIDNHQITEDDAKFIINPYDEYAVEEAVKIKEEIGGEVTVITFGPQRADSALRTALAMGADKAILIDSESFDLGADEYMASVILASAVKKQPYDIILCGNMAVDGGSAQVGPRVAEILGIPHITAITKLELQDRNVLVERDVEGDTETITSMTPILLTTQQGLNEPRYPSMTGIVKAKKKPLDFLSSSDLEIEAHLLKAKTSVADRYLPEQKGAGQILSGSLEEQAKQLVLSLRQEAKVV